MSDNYVEVLVKRNIEKEKKNRKIIMIVIFAILIMAGIMTSISGIYYLIVLAVLVYYFLAVKYCIEFEYFYMDGELSISKIVNKSRRKTILRLNDGLIKVIAPVGSAELQGYYNLKELDCTARELSNLPYRIVYIHNGEQKAVNIQMTDELYKELKKNMPYKVKRY